MHDGYTYVYFDNDENLLLLSLGIVWGPFNSVLHIKPVIVRLSSSNVGFTRKRTILVKVTRTL